MGQENAVTVYVETSVDTSGAVQQPGHSSSRGSSTSSSASRRRNATVRRPNIMVVSDNVEAVRGDLSPTSQKITAPRGHPPCMSVEVTSTETSRRVDLNVKWKEYAASNIEEYMIIDRNIPSRSNACVIVGKLQRDRSGRTLPEYSQTFFRGNAVVQCTYLNELNCTADTLLNPPPAKRTAASPIRRAQAREAEERRQKQEERRKKEKAKKKAKNYKRKLRDLGEAVSDSSSSSS